jgi:hypothetical protein
MFALMPWLKPEDTPLCRSWAQFEFLGDQVYAGLRADGVLNGQGESRRLLDDFRRLRLAQATLAAELGMSPGARTRLKAGGETHLSHLSQEEGVDVERLTLIGLRTVWKHLEKQQEQEALEVTAEKAEDSAAELEGVSDGTVSPVAENGAPRDDSAET